MSNTCDCVHSSGADYLGEHGRDYGSEAGALGRVCTGAESVSDVYKALGSASEGALRIGAQLCAV